MRSEEDPGDHIKDGSPIKGDPTIPQIPNVIGLLNAVLHMHVHKSLDTQNDRSLSLSLFRYRERNCVRQKHNLITRRASRQWCVTRWSSVN